MFADPRLTQNDVTPVGGLLGMATQIGGAMVEMIKDPLAKNVPLPGGSGGGGGVGGYNPNARPDPYAARPPGANNLALQTGGQWTMASNRGPNAYNGGGGGGDFGTMAHPPAPSSNHNNESEYYKARNAQGTGQALSWAHTATIGGVGATTTSTTAPSSGVGGSWAMTSVAPPPHLPQSVASMARQPSVASAVPVTNGYVGGGYAATGVTGACATTGGGGGEYERNLILELCPPGGMKAEPPADKLDEFAHAIPSLNPDVVCPALLDALEEGNPWIMRAKALCVIETVLRVEAERVMTVGGGETPYTDFFHACSAEIEPLAEHARASVKAPAKRVLTALGIDETSMMNGSSANHHVTAVAHSPVAPPPNLLDFDAPIALEETPASDVAAPSPPAAEYGSTAATMAGTGGSLFSGLNTKATHIRDASAPVVSSPPVTADPSTSVQDDLLGGFGTDSSAPATSSFNEMFGNMTVKDTADVNSNCSISAPAESAPAALSGSSFGFMNTSPASPVPPPSALPVPAAFDPLLGLGMPVSNGNMNNITPSNTFITPNPNIAQMQLAYQQNMLMMQMQQHSNGGVLRGGMSGMPMMVSPQPTNKSIMGANYMRQVPGVSGDKMSSFSFLGRPPTHEKENKSFDFVMDAMKSEKK